MDKDEFLGVRRHALEDAFFKKVEADNLAKLRAEMARKGSREELGKATGIGDPGVLDALVALGVSAGTVTALALAPLVRVAWADGALQSGEREAILRSARDRGVTDGSPAHALLASWLDHAPDASLDQAWAAYTGALCGALGAEQRDALRDQVVGFARSVAEAAGGFLGMATISAAEEQALAAIAAAFG